MKIENTRPHVVILGAGATVATIPNGNKYSNPCSVMHGFIHNLGLDTILASVKLNTKSENIEDIYIPNCMNVVMNVNLFESNLKMQYLLIFRG